MSAQQKPEPGTSLAVTSSSSVGVLPPELQQALQLRRMRNQVAGQLAAQNWGKSLDLDTRRAIADWGQQFRVDVTTEIHVLGGNVYLNSAFFLRQLSELIEAGLVEYAYADHIEDDARLKALGPEGEGEYSRRLRERIMHQVPDKAASAVVFRVKLRSMDREITGCKWCGNGTRKNDPVGDDKPVETSESRAARRAMRLISSHVPRHVAEDMAAIEASAEALTERVKQARVNFAISEAAIAGGPKHLPPAVSTSSPYDLDAAAPAQNAPEARRETAPPRTAAQRAAADAAANAPDPFADGEGSSEQADAEGAEWDQPSEIADAPEREPLACELYEIPKGLGPKSGRQLREFSTEDLDSLYRWGSKPAILAKYPDLAHHCEQLLEARRLGEAGVPSRGSRPGAGR